VANYFFALRSFENNQILPGRNLGALAAEYLQNLSGARRGHWEEACVRFPWRIQPLRPSSYAAMRYWWPVHWCGAPP
jgi:hypothetical protein